MQHGISGIQETLAQGQPANTGHTCTAATVEGYWPADQARGVGAGAWMPSLTEATARLGIEVPFETAAEGLGVPVPTEDVRKATEGIGAVADAEEQAAVDRAKQCKEQPGEVDTDTLVVAVDGCMVHAGKAWHEMKVGVCAPLGSECERVRIRVRCVWPWDGSHSAQTRRMPSRSGVDGMRSS